MRLFRLTAFGALAATVAACNPFSKETGGFVTTPDPVAGFRAVHVSPDLASVDFRVVDVVANAPNQVAAPFRGGGLPYGVTTSLLPHHMAVAVGTRTLRVFRASTDPAVASQVVFESNYTFTEGTNYTLLLYGYSVAANGTPSLRAMLVEDNPPDLGTTPTQIAWRVINLGPSLAPTLATTTVDVYVDAVAGAADPTGPCGASEACGLAFEGVSGYFLRAPLAGLRAAVVPAAATTPVVAAAMPAGLPGDATLNNPVAGATIAGSAITAVIVPATVAGSPGVASFTTPSVIYLIDRRPPRTAP